MREFTQKCPHCQSNISLTNEWIGMTYKCPICSKGFPVKKPVILKKLSTGNRNISVSPVQFYEIFKPVILKFAIGIILIILSLPLLATFYVWLGWNININEEARKYNYSRVQISKARSMNNLLGAWDYVFKQIVAKIK